MKLYDYLLQTPAVIYKGGIDVWNGVGISIWILQRHVSIVIQALFVISRLYREANKTSSIMSIYLYEHK